MVAPKTLFYTIAVATILTAVPTVAHEDKRYVAAELIAIWCDEGGHQYTPIGDPDDHEDPISWAFSGEPECAAGDLISDNGESAIGGFALTITPEDLGSVLAVGARDDVFADGPPLTITFSRPGERVAHYGCGSVGAEIPPDIGDPFIGAAIVWTFIDIVETDPDTMEPCFGSTGEYTYTM